MAPSQHTRRSRALWIVESQALNLNSLRFWSRGQWRLLWWPCMHQPLSPSCQALGQTSQAGVLVSPAAMVTSWGGKKKSPPVLTDVFAPETALLKNCASDKGSFVPQGPPPCGRALCLWQGTLLVAVILCRVIGASFLPNSRLVWSRRRSRLAAVIVKLLL